MISFPIILLRLAVALVLGAVIGFEREQKEHGAGMRTLALVSLGSALFTIVSAYGFLSLLVGIPRLVLDPTRIASYIVAGIGFLGAGTIFLSREKEKVKGLTTAATIWVIAAVGLACGAGLLWEATATTILTLFVLILLQFLERAIIPRSSSSSTQHLYIEVPFVSSELLASVYNFCMRNKVTIEKLHVHTVQGGEAIELICNVPGEEILVKLVGELHALPGVNAIHANLHSSAGDSPSPDDSTH
jgi:putative Mg2+ transporter-C (MgtC) family protein